MKLDFLLETMKNTELQEINHQNSNQAVEEAASLIFWVKDYPRSAFLLARAVSEVNERRKVL